MMQHVPALLLGLLAAYVGGVLAGALIVFQIMRKQVNAAKQRGRRYAAAVDDLDRWCGHPFPCARIIARHLHAAGEGRGLNAGSPVGEEACTITGLREQLARLAKKGGA